MMHTMDSLSSDLQSKVIRAQRRNTEIITSEDENLLWAKGVHTWQWITTKASAYCFLLHRLHFVSEVYKNNMS